MINNPIELSACVIWLDGSNSTYLKSLSTGSGDVTDGSAVGYWQNLGSLSSAGHFTNIGGDSTTRPTYISSLSCLRFSNAQYLTLSATQAYTAQTVFVATSPFAFVDQDRIYSQAASGAADNATYLPLVQTGTSGGVCSYTGAATTARSSTSHRTLSTFDTFTSWHSGGGIQNFRNGESATSFAHTLGTLTALRHRVGASITNTGAAASFYSGDISEVIVYSRALTNAEREDVEYYLSRKWSVLNSIPRQVYALKSGNWSDSTLWSVSADPVPWNFPLSADNVYTNTFTVTADSSTRVDTIRNSALVPNIAAGGSFVLANGVSLSANILNGASPFCATLLPSASATINGTILGVDSIDIPALSASFNSTLTINGSLNGGVTSGFLQTSSNVNLIINGDIFCAQNGGSGNRAALIPGQNNNIFIRGNLSSSSADQRRAIVLTSNSSGILQILGNIIRPSAGNWGGVIDITGGSMVVSVTGNLVASSGTGGPYGAVYITGGSPILNIVGSFITGNDYPLYVSGGTPQISIFSNIQASNRNNAIFSSITTPLSVYGNIINAPNGRQAIYAPRYQVFPTSSPTYTRHAVNGYDSFVDYWTSDATFSYPASSDVVRNVLYNNNTLSGSMIIPPVSSVALGALVGNTAGTASLTLNDLWNTSTTSLTASNSIGSRLRNISTTQALTAIVDSLT